MTLDEALGTWVVLEPESWENNQGPEGWWAVGDNGGLETMIVAYFIDARSAFRYRLNMVNREVNP